MPKKSAKAVTPMHDLAGSAGNMQDVSDLQKMLAQSQAELAAAREEIESLKGELKTARWEGTTQRAELYGVRRDLHNLKEGASDPIHISGLIACRRAMKAGRIADADYELDRVLSDMDPTWRTAA